MTSRLHRIRGRKRRTVYFLAAVIVIVATLVAASGQLGWRRSPKHHVGSTVAAWVLRMVAGTQDVIDARGMRWIPDRFAVGGRLVGSAGLPVETASPQLVAVSRIGTLGYDVPVPRPGVYAVALTFVEPSGLGAGARVFDVSANHLSEARGVDIAKAVGLDKPYELLFTIPVTGSVLAIRLQARTGETTVSDVAVALQSTDPTIHDTFFDDFNGPSGSAPNSNTWGYDTGDGGWGNAELETYTAEPTNVALDGQGHLVIAAYRTGHQTYTSARLTTLGRQSFTYGTITARIQVPAGQGLWPAFWAEGSDLPQVGWPRSGEIDVLEARGSEPTKAYGTVIGQKGAASEHYSLQGTFAGSSPLSSGFHTYGVVWTPLGMAFQIDSSTYFTALPQDLSPSNQYPFDNSFFLLLNLAVGGNFGGAPDSTAGFPARMLVDWVRVTG